MVNIVWCLIKQNFNMALDISKLAIFSKVRSEVSQTFSSSSQVTQAGWESLRAATDALKLKDSNLKWSAD